jgi:hypothetical protein
MKKLITEIDAPFVFVAAIIAIILICIYSISKISDDNHDGFDDAEIRCNEGYIEFYHKGKEFWRITDRKCRKE